MRAFRKLRDQHLEGAPRAPFFPSITYLLSRGNFMQSQVLPGKLPL
jgi:hypothetical protein